MLGIFFRLTNGIPAVLDIRNRVNANGVIVPPLWVRYERPVSIPPHNSPMVRADLMNFAANGVRRVRHRPSGAVYTFGPWVPTRRILRQGEHPPLLRLPSPGLSSLSERNTSRIQIFGLSEALQYSYMLDHRFAIYMTLSILLSLWFISVPAPLALKPEVLSSVDLGLISKVAHDTFVDGVCSTHPHIQSPCDCGEPLNTTLKSFLDVDKIYDEKGEYKQERVISAIGKYFLIITIFVALYESVSPDGVWVDTSSWF